MEFLTYHFLAWISFVTAIYAWIVDPLINKENDNETIVKYLPFLYIAISTFFLCLDANNSIPMSIYYSFIVFVNSIDIESKRILYYLIDILSKVILITTLFEGIRNSIERAYYFYFYNNKTYIIHSDNELGELLYKNINNPYKVILCKSDNENHYERFKNHILLYEEDDDNVRLCTELSKEEKKDIYIFTKNIDMSYFVKDNIHPLNLNQIVATKFWVEAAEKINEKLVANKYKLTIGIVGEEELTTSIFEAALQYNIYSTKQKIEYHCISSEDTIGMLKKQTKLIENKMLDDSYNFYNWNEYNNKKTNKNKIKDFDILVVCDNSYYSKDITSTAKADNIYVFNKYYSNEDNLNNVNNGNSKSREILFGSYNKLLTINNILNEDLVTGGKVINLFYNYIEKLESLEALSEKERIEKMNSLWLKANSYNRNSSIVASQYNKIRQTINKTISDKNLDELGQLEHTRWCRFVYLDGWTHLMWDKNLFGDYEEKLYISKIDIDDIKLMSDDEIAKKKFYIKGVKKNVKGFVQVSKKEGLYVSFRTSRSELLSAAIKDIELFVVSDEENASDVVTYRKKITKNETYKYHIFLVPYAELPEFDTIKDRTISLNTNYIEDLKQKRK